MVLLYMSRYATYQISLKIFLRKNGAVLLLRDKKGIWDLPGGRIDVTEIHTPIYAILAREVAEELGGEVRYTLGLPMLQFTRFLADQPEPVFIIVYEAQYLSGSIRLSDEHKHYAWIDPSRHSLTEKDFFSKEEYAFFVSYFQKSSSNE